MLCGSWGTGQYELKKILVAAYDSFQITGYS